MILVGTFQLTVILLFYDSVICFLFYGKTQ